MAKKRTNSPAGPSTPGAKPKRRRVKVTTGQIVAIPLRDGSYALGHVARYSYLQAIVAHFDHRAEAPADLLTNCGEAMKHRLLTILAVTSDEISDGLWPVIGHQEPRYPETMLDMKGTSYTANVSRWFFDAYYGLVPWDAMAATPNYFERMLLPGVPVPPTARYKRDFEQEAATSSPTSATSSTKASDSKPCSTQGPAVKPAGFDADARIEVDPLNQDEDP